MGDRWTATNAEMIVGVPWNTGENDEDADGEQMELIRPEPGEVPARVKDKVFGEIPVPRRMRIGRKELQQHGFDAKCEGCQSVLRGGLRGLTAILAEED